MMSHKRSRKQQDILTQTEKDAIAIYNTNIVRHEKKNFNSSKASWIPKSIQDENSIFSKKVPVQKVHTVIQKPMKKQSGLVSTPMGSNILNMPSDFRPCVKKANLSQKNSQLFTEGQEERKWNSSCKKVDFLPLSKEENRRKCFRESDSSLKRASIDLGWCEEVNTKPKDSRYRSQSGIKGLWENSDKKEIFQAKRRTNQMNNMSSIMFG